MKWLFLFFVTVGGIIFPQKNISLQAPISIIPTQNAIPTQASNKEKTSIFVPYWGLGKKIETETQRLIYFGITLDIKGDIKKDAGFQNIQNFTRLAGQREKYLTIRMTDFDVNNEILKNDYLQKKITEESILIVRKNGFDGVVLDLELSNLSFDSVVSKVNNFIQTFYLATQTEKTPFAVAIYGDAFYRARPYDAAFIAKHSDEIIVMAYDFHKARGEAGPNFPLAGRDIYGYDFQQMIDDFSKDVPKEKLTVAFGMFGYDWILDSENRTQKVGNPLSLNAINERFLTNCEAINCSITKDEQSAETQVKYTDKDGSNHIVWFESMESVEKKKQYLKTKGVSSYAFWAHSYY